MAGNYEKQLESRIEELEQQLQVSEKVAVRNYQILKKILIDEIVEATHSRTSFGMDIPLITIDEKIINKLSDEEIKNVYTKYEQEVRDMKNGKRL